MSEVGAALIGPSGMWGPKIADAAERAGNLRLVTCYGRDEERRRAFADERGIEAAESFEAAVEHPEVEAVLLVTPNDVHAEQALACSERGRHVFVEKPIADAVAAAERMRDAFAAAGLVLAVGHGMRRLGGARRTKELIDDGALGTVVLAEANWSLTGSSSPQSWRWYRERNRGGPLMQTPRDVTGIVEVGNNLLGKVRVQEIFKVSKIGTIAGCRVTDGLIRRQAKARLIRDGVVIWEGDISSRTVATTAR